MIRILIAAIGFGGMIVSNSRLLIVVIASEAPTARLAIQMLICFAGLTAAALLYYMALLW